MVHFGQKISGKLQFSPGETLQVVMETKSTIAQEAMGQVIDFNVNGVVTRQYTVTNATDDNSTLNHKVKRITFSFDGMGQKRNFDSDNPKDLNGQMGQPIKDLLDKNYNMIIDPSGNVLMAIPEKFESTNGDDRMMIITNMLKDVLGSVQPPKKGEASLFKVLPEKELEKGDSWNDTTVNESGKGITTYTLSDITDSALVITFKGTSTSTSKAEFMGMQTSTNLNNTTTGKIIVDKNTFIIKEKTSVTDSKGTTEAMGGQVPVTSKITMTIKVNPSN
jgi:hypothetical protein